MGRLSGMVIKDGGGWKHGRKEGGGVNKFAHFYSSPFSMIPLSYHGYKGNERRGISM